MSARSSVFLAVHVIGLVLAAGGFITAFATLGSIGGLAKSRTFAAIGAASPRAKRVLLGAALAMGAGMLLAMIGVGGGDPYDTYGCRGACREAGFEDGRLERGARPAPSAAPALSCRCDGPAGGALVPMPARPTASARGR
ncbi:MAG TPA: hypothetical protein VFS43_28285 [Polyangiaceae bacterium]|nr:hypothetical protein [Polyangiaceae bacterium]